MKNLPLRMLFATIFVSFIIISSNAGEFTAYHSELMVKGNYYVWECIHIPPSNNDNNDRCGTRLYNSIEGIDYRKAFSDDNVYIVEITILQDLGHINYLPIQEHPLDYMKFAINGVEINTSFQKEWYLWEIFEGGPNGTGKDAFSKTLSREASNPNYEFNDSKKVFEFTYTSTDNEHIISLDNTIINKTTGIVMYRNLTQTEYSTSPNESVQLTLLNETNIGQYTLIDQSTSETIIQFTPISLSAIGISVITISMVSKKKNQI